MKTGVVFVLATVQLAAGVIYRLNDSEYARMPKLYYLDDFNDCLREPGDVYCNVDAQLVGNSTNELFTLLREYSDDTITHYDRTEIHWGICVTKMCEEFLSKAASLRRGLEACLNSTVYGKYQLQTRVIHETTFCTEFGESPEYDSGDYLVAVVYFALLMASCLGTGYDTFFYKGTKSFASKILLCFSVRRNWSRLVAAAGEGPDPRLSRLKGLNGIKVMSTLLVILGHSAVTGLAFIDNPEFQENTYKNPLYQILYNGTFIVQTFFLISGFLLAFNVLIATEKRPAGIAFLIQSVFLRWLRLVPAYAVVLAFVSTWLRHLGSGPLWKPVVNIEVHDCRRHWWYHLLFIDNYIDNSQCMPQSWYLAGDMQLSILGLTILCLLKSTRARKVAVALTFVVGLLTPALHTFLQDLHPVLIVTPEMARRYFVKDATFNNLYKRGHTNLVCYAMGLALGMAMYQLHSKGFNIEKYKKYRPIFWGSFPMALVIILCGMMFYIEGFVMPLEIRVVYSSSAKFLFGLCMTVLVAGTVTKLDNLYRGVLEWGGWTAMSRLSYCAYLIHVCVVRTSVVHYSSLQHTTVYKMLVNYFGITGVTYVASVACWILAEAPLGQLIKTCLAGHKQKQESPPPQEKVTEVRL